VYTFSEIRAYIRRKGISGFFKLGIYIIHKNFNKYIFYRIQEILMALPLEDFQLDFPIPENITIRSARFEDIDELMQIIKKYRWPTNKKDLTEWINREYPIHVAISKGKIIGYTCVILDLDFINQKVLTRLKPNPDDAWGRDALILPEYRGEQIYQALSSHSIRGAKAAGYNRILATAIAHNYSGRKAHKKLGQRELKRLNTYKIFTREFVTIRPMKRRSRDEKIPESN
jgi:GNAT superfamily N-acetyltransferase